MAAQRPSGAIAVAVALGSHLNPLSLFPHTRVIVRINRSVLWKAEKMYSRAIAGLAGSSWGGSTCLGLLAPERKVEGRVTFLPFHWPGRGGS